MWNLWKFDMVVMEQTSAPYATRMENYGFGVVATHQSMTEMTNRQLLLVSNLKKELT